MPSNNRPSASAATTTTTAFHTPTPPLACRPLRAAIVLAATLLSPTLTAQAQTPPSGFSAPSTLSMPVQGANPATNPAAASSTTSAAPAMTTETPVAAAPSSDSRLFDLRRRAEDERQFAAQLGAILENRVILQRLLREARNAGIPLDDIQLPGTAQTIAAASDAEARRQAEAAARAREQAAREQAAREAAERDGPSQDTASLPSSVRPAQGGQSAGTPSTATTTRVPARSIQPADLRPRWLEIGGVAPQLYAMIADRNGARPVNVREQLSNGWTIISIAQNCLPSPKSKCVTALDRSGEVHSLRHISEAD